MSTPSLPAGFTVRLGSGTHTCDGGRLLVGGSGAVLRLRPRARLLLSADGTLVARDADSSTMARLLLDRGLADPWWSSHPDDDAVRDVTVVVPVRDRPHHLARLLAALPGLPVVVVDDGSCDPGATRAIASEFGARLVRHPRSTGPAAARNSGLLAVRTPFVAFLDSDVVPVPGWLGTLRRHLDDPAVAVVGPRVLGREPQEDDSWLCRYEAARSSLDLGPEPAPVQPLGRVAYLPSAALLARREALGSGFDERMHVAEDVDLVWRVREEGWRVRYEPAAAVRHDHRTELAPWLRRKAYYGTGAAPLASRYGSDVAPLVLSPWTAALTLAVLAQRRWSLPLAVAVAAAVSVRIAGKLDTDDRPLRTAASLTALGGVSALTQAGSALTRHYWPVAAVAAVRFPRARRALVVAAVADALLDHHRVHPDLDPVRFLVARRLDDLAYGAGLWAGALRAGSPRALVPALRGFPSPRRGT
ncbi:MAG: mycofactocin biosynthesis glycosyltransferase MftF [Nocardioidaceae bacterium]